MRTQNRTARERLPSSLIWILCGMGILLGTYCYFRWKTRIVRSYKVRVINRNRKQQGFYNTMFLPMKRNDPSQFFKYTRMSVPAFDKLLHMIEPKIINNKQLPDHVCPEERLAVALHYFSQGTSMQSIAWTYHLGHTTVHKITKDISVILWDVLSPNYLKTPCSKEEWRDISKLFYKKCNFPNCVGALDGKHINIQAPPHSRSQYFNDKKGFSIVLMASCDADYNFILSSNL
ncbi:hypothetical protein NQ315_000444 [Exocentrus adspersus]|uniref:DDE Tnp4 domain-containing protein n=1 Tax=Exocentrus adspersus TaxID=1586481 RepID=A0AAV8V5A9_9CUCU|nr:hypothetical protein NQ315_000444 [Exocentrus adspersus]